MSIALSYIITCDCKTSRCRDKFRGRPARAEEDVVNDALAAGWLAVTGGGAPPIFYCPQHWTRAGQRRRTRKKAA